MHPLNIVKSRQQVSFTNESATKAFTELLTGRNLQSLYKGFGWTVSTTIPSKLLYLATIDSNQEALYHIFNGFPLEEKNKKFLSSETASVISTILAQSISVPGDIIKKTIMAQGYDKRKAYSGGLDIISQILKTDGVNGLYKGGLTTCFSHPFDTITTRVQ
ncbi:solute carrier family 25 member 44-like, partial [Trifolium medium]|nr:solute carrier family 25 member 44-like [Trifolium medium]